jgi:hypothetical protein
VKVDEEVLLDAVRDLQNAGKLAHAENVRVELGEGIADDGGYFDVGDVADDLAELMSIGKLELARRTEWEGSEPMPKTRTPYALPRQAAGSRRADGITRALRAGHSDDTDAPYRG